MKRIVRKHPVKESVSVRIIFQNIREKEYLAKCQGKWSKEVFKTREKFCVWLECHVSCSKVVLRDASPRDRRKVFETLVPKAVRA